MLPTYTEATGIETEEAGVEMDELLQPLQQVRSMDAEMLPTYADVTGVAEDEGLRIPTRKPSLLERSRDWLDVAANVFGWTVILGFVVSLLTVIYYWLAGCNPDALGNHACAVVSATIAATGVQGVSDRWMCEGTHLAVTWTRDQAPTINTDHCTICVWPNDLSTDRDDGNYPVGGHVTVMLSWLRDDYGYDHIECRRFYGGDWNTHDSQMIALKVMLVFGVALVIVCCFAILLGGK